MLEERKREVCEGKRLLFHENPGPPLGKHSTGNDVMGKEPSTCPSKHILALLVLVTQETVAAHWKQIEKEPPREAAAWLRLTDDWKVLQSHDFLTTEECDIQTVLASTYCTYRCSYLCKSHLCLYPAQYLKSCGAA